VDSFLDVRECEVAGVHLNSQPLDLLMVSVSFNFQTSVLLIEFSSLLFCCEDICFGIFDLLVTFFNLG
jgi:hypothetical protein